MVAELAAIQEREHRDPRLENVVVRLFQSASTPQKLAILRAIPTGLLENPAQSMTKIHEEAVQPYSLVSSCISLLEGVQMIPFSPVRKGVVQNKSFSALGREVMPYVIEAMQTYFEQTQTDLVFPPSVWSPEIMPNVLNTLLSARVSTTERRDNQRYITILPNIPAQAKPLQAFGEDCSEGFLLNSKGIHLYDALTKITEVVLGHKDEILRLLGPLPLFESTSIG